LQPNIKSVTEYAATAPIFIALGVLLPVVFVIMSRAVERAGIVKSDAAQRLSLFIPIVWALAFFGEVLTPARGLGVVLAFVALLCLLYKPSIQKFSSNTKGVAASLMGVWLGYGVIDILFKQLAKLDKTAFSGNLLVAFILAGVLMWAYLLVKRTDWRLKSMLAGIALGVLNFGNILFYVRAHQVFKDNPTLVFAGMNMGVIALGTLVGAWAFREKISRVNALGVALAMASIFCLFYLAKLVPQWA
ncbi:MAG: EamA/RhaT family transporter, partial [Hydromonas sp.]|nr:EamA/RhaT family transporter [Hydromonas sp.]